MQLIKLIRNLSLVVASSAMFVVFSSSAVAEQVNIYGWPDEYPQETLDAFTDATGIDVIFDTLAATKR